MLRKASLRDSFTSLLLRRSYICPSCSSKIAAYTRATTLPTHNLNPRFLNPKSAAPGLHRSIHRRHISTTSSVTTVNVPRSTPRTLQKLDQSLSALKKDAAVYVNSSQLGLALRGLESENAIIRIAVLGVESKQGAARLTRALLADPLAPEPLWEKELTDPDFLDGKAILLRYGEKFKTDSSHPLVKTLFIPSSILHTHTLEILVQSVDPGEKLTGTDSLLVPSIETQGSSRGRMSMVTYPVHKVLVYAEDLQTLPAMETTQYMGSMVQRVVDGSWSALQPRGGQAPSIIPVNLSLSEVAIETFRKSLERSIEFEHAWFDSGMPGVASWLSEGTDASPGTLKPSVRRLVEQIITTTSQAIQNEQDTQLQEAKAKEVSTATKDALNHSVTVWAENAHTELRDRLNSAFISHSWSKTKWWKLFWRVDEVGFAASDILNRGWLVDSEKEMIWISGRIQQAGLLGPPSSKPPVEGPKVDNERTGLLRGPGAPLVSDVLDDIKPFEPDDEEEALIVRPWPDNISYARSVLSLRTIPPFQALSQNLMLQTVSTTFLTSTLSALVYVSVSSTSLYEAGAIAALGLAFSLRRLQKKWESARNAWRVGVREHGRKVLRNEEQLLRDTIKRGGEVQFDFAAVEQRRIASEAVAKVREGLGEVGGKGDGG